MRLQPRSAATTSAQEQSTAHQEPPGGHPFHTLPPGESLAKAQHRQGTGACGTGQDELIGQVAPLAEVLQGIDHRVGVIDDHTAGAHQPLQQFLAAQHPGHLRQHHIREVDAAGGDRIQKGPLSDGSLLGVIAD